MPLGEEVGQFSQVRRQVRDNQPVIVKELIDNGHDAATRLPSAHFSANEIETHGSGLILPICLVNRNAQVKPKNEANMPKPAQNHSQFTLGQLSVETAGALEIKDITVPLVPFEKTV